MFSNFVGCIKKETVYKAILGGVLALLLLVNVYVLACWVIGDITSDMLLLPGLYHDMAAGTYQPFYWCLPPSRYIFPDLFLYFPIRALVGNDLVALVAQTILYAGIIVFLLSAIIKHLTNWSYFRVFFGVTVGVIVIATMGLLPMGISYGLLLPSYHGGAMVMLLVLALILLKMIQCPTVLRACLLGLLAFGGGYTESLLFVVFFVPATVTLILTNSLTPKLRVGLIILIWGGSLLGSVFGESQVAVSQLQYVHQNIASINLIRTSVEVFLKDLMIPSTYISSLVLVGGSLLLLRRRLDVPLSLGIVSLMLLPVISSLLIGRYEGVSHYRYFPFAFLVPLLGITFSTIHERLSLRPLLIVLLLLVSTVFVSVKNWPSWSRLNYPPIVKSIDSVKEIYGLKAGLANFWIAHPVRALSQKGLVVNDLKASGVLNLKLCNLLKLGLSYLPAPGLDYNYIVMQGLDPVAVKLRFGVPTKVEEISLGPKESVSLWIYNYNLGRVLENDQFLIMLLAQRIHLSSHLIPRDNCSHQTELLQTFLSKDASSK